VWSALHASHFTPGKETLYPLYRRLSRPQSQSRQVQNTSPPLRLDPCTVQPIVSRCTNSTIPAHVSHKIRQINHLSLFEWWILVLWGTSDFQVKWDLCFVFELWSSHSDECEDCDVLVCGSMMFHTCVTVKVQAAGVSTFLMPVFIRQHDVTPHNIMILVLAVLFWRLS